MREREKEINKERDTERKRHGRKEIIHKIKR